MGVQQGSHCPAFSSPTASSTPEPPRPLLQRHARHLEVQANPDLILMFFDSYFAGIPRSCGRVLVPNGTRKGASAGTDDHKIVQDIEP